MSDEAALAAEADRAFFGHPKGLGFLAFAEGWTGFSYYGMLALLVLYSAGELLPHHSAEVWGFAPFHRFLEAIYGPLTTEATATAITGMFGALVYATPLLGGALADRWLGRTPTVILGAVLMTLGHFLMTFYATFLPALAAILIGIGCFNANLRAQVGELYAVGDLRRANAFQIYTLAVNIAVIGAPLVVGTLGEKHGFAWGFAAAGTGMALGLLVYLAGIRHLPASARPETAPAAAAPRAHLTPHERHSVLILVLLVPVIALCFVGNQQIFNAYLLWGKDHYDLVFRGESMPVSWLLSLDAFISTAAIFGSLLFWRWWAKHRPEPNETIKIAGGTLIAAAAPLSLALGSWVMGDAKLGLIWGVGFHVINNIGFANVYPIGLALYSRASPRSLTATMVSVFSLSIFCASLLDGKLGGFLEKMSPTAFWIMHAVLVALGGLLMLAAARLFRSTLSPRDEAERSS
jgi:POT family proton-dependent oligopeptide transporter